MSHSSLRNSCDIGVWRKILLIALHKVMLCMGTEKPSRQNSVLLTTVFSVNNFLVNEGLFFSRKKIYSANVTIIFNINVI